MHLHHNDFVEVVVVANNRAGLTTSTKTNGYSVDTTGPELKYLRDNNDGRHYQTNKTTVTAFWRFDDPESSIEEYRVFIMEEFQ